MHAPVLGRHRARRPLAIAVIVAGSFLGGVLAPSALGVSVALFSPPPVRSTGVVTYDRATADAGYVTVAPINGREVQLVAKDGRVVHTWSLQYPIAGMVTLDPDGSLLYLGQLPKWKPPTPQPGVGGAGGIIQRVAWDGHVLWSFEDDLIHHDFTELPDGTIAALRWTQLSPTEAASIPGGARVRSGVPMWTDQIVEIDPASGRERVVFDVSTAWRPEDHPLPAWMPRSEWTHANSIEYTPSDPVTHQPAYLISFREVSTILLVSQATGQILWSYGGLFVLDQQHDPTLLPDGHILVFDNGQYRQGAASYSSVLEIDPTTDKVVWSYGGYGIAGTKFYSAITGGAQRLPNGDTLVTLGLKGQLLEVTSGGSVVWDYRVNWGPTDPKYPGIPLSFLFKSRSYPASEIAPMLNGGTTGG